MNAKSWDTSIISLTPEERDAMDASERRERLAEEIFRAADILATVIDALGSDMHPHDQETIIDIAQVAHMIARRADPVE